jgi:ADP-heptose:LPS heptosyltransferase
MRWVDHWIGLPLCFVLGLACRIGRRLRRAPTREPDLSAPLAVFKFFGLGSFMQLTPLLRTLHDRRPAGRSVVVTFEANASLLSRLGACDDLLVIRTRSPWVFVRDVLATILWLRRRRPGIAIDLEFFSKFSTLLSYLSGAPVRIAYHLNDYWRHMLVTHPINYNYYRHISELYEQVATRLGLAVADRRLSRIALGEQDHHAVEAFLRQNGVSAGAPLIGVNVNSGDLALERRWPLDRFAELLEHLLTNHRDWFIVLTGSPGEIGYVTSLWQRLPQGLRHRVINSAGALTFEQFVALLTRTCVFVTNDSGPMHLAAAHGVPLVSLWGPQRPEFYSPGGGRHIAISQNYPCSPCLHMFTSFAGMWCNHEGWCMQAIETQRVVEAVEAVFASGSPTCLNGA